MFSPEEVPIWDESRDFPRELRYEKVHVQTDRDAAISVPAADAVVFRAAGDTDLDVLRNWIGDDWSPRSVSATAKNFPWLVRADYTEPLRLEDRTDVDVVGELAALARHYPFKGQGYDKRMLRQVAELNALVGQPRDGTNTLKTWLELALEVKAHIETRTALDKIGGDISLFLHELSEKNALWHADPTHRRVFSRHWTPYRALEFMTREATTKSGVVESIRELLEAVFSGNLESTALTKQGLTTQSSLWNWTRYRLLEVWSEGAELRKCEGCGEFFLQRRCNQTHCHSRCRRRAFGVRQRGDMSEKVTP